MTINKTQWISDAIADLKTAGLFNTIRTIDSPMDGRVTIDGREMLNFCANNYLGLANDPRIKQAAKDAIDAYGVGPGAEFLKQEMQMLGFDTGQTLPTACRWAAHHP